MNHHERKLQRIKLKFYDQDGRCALCKKDLVEEMRELSKWFYERINGEGVTKRRGQININYDHIIPLSKGGKDKRSNKQVTHATCNSSKGNKILLWDKSND